MRALLEESVLQLVAQALHLDAQPAARPEARRAPASSRPRAAARKRAARPQADQGAGRSAARPRGAKAGGSQEKEKPRRAKPAPKSTRGALQEPQVAAEEQPAAAGEGVEGTASALLAHVQIEPGQGIEDLALAMGTPANALEGPLQELLDQQKITERREQGEPTYYPA